MKNKLLIAALAIIIGACAMKEAYTITVESSGTKIATGKLTRSLLETDKDFAGWFKYEYSAYQPEKTSTAFLDSTMKDKTCIVFLGTWCSDSRRDVPRMLKVLDSAKVSEKNISLYGVDRLKKCESGLAEKYHITRVPTLIILKDSTEVGRIVEKPTETIDRDMVKLIKKF